MERTGRLEWELELDGNGITFDELDNEIGLVEVVREAEVKAANGGNAALAVARALGRA